MIYCPIMSYQRDNTSTKPCMENSCAFADEAGECLIKQALQCYVNAEHARVAEEAERIRKETQLAKTYWAMKKDGTQTPIQFLQDGDMTPYTPLANTKLDPDYPKIDMYDEPVPGGIRWAHQPVTEKYPHGGWFEDLNPIRQVKTSDIETGVGY